MTCLFLDTSSDILVLSLIKDNSVIDTIKLESAKTHSIYAVDTLKKIIEENNLTPNDIDKVFVVNGPGSFTGIRIGVTIAKTFCYALDKDITPISSLKMKILGFDGFDYYVSLIKDKRDLYYLGIYDKNYNTISEELISENEMNEKINNLDGNIKKIESSLDTEFDLDILKIVKYYDKEKCVNPHKVNPNYLKEVV